MPAQHLRMPTIWTLPRFERSFRLSISRKTEQNPQDDDNKGFTVCELHWFRKKCIQFWRFKVRNLGGSLYHPDWIISNIGADIPPDLEDLFDGRKAHHTAAGNQAFLATPALTSNSELTLHMKHLSCLWVTSSHRFTTFEYAM